MREHLTPHPTLAGPVPARERERRERLDLPTQRARLNRLARELEIDPRSLAKDQSGDWMLEGEHGTVHALPRGYELLVSCESAEQWASAKAMLDFVSILKRNETSGILRLSKLPTPDEGDAIVAALGLKRPADLMVESLGRILAWRAPA